MMMLRSLLALLVSCCSSVLLLVGVVLYAHYVEPRWVEETHWELRAEHWRGKPLRLAVMADLHARAGDGEAIDAIVQRVLAAQPDAVLLLGDYFNDQIFEEAMDAETLGRHLAPLAQLPCFAVLGNHDYDYGAPAVRAMLQGFGAHVMESRVHALELGGDTLYLGGIRCMSHFDTPGEVVAPKSKGVPMTYLVLSHSPVGAHYAPPGTTATLAGHTHGGQVCLPGGNPILRPDRRVTWQEMQGEFITAGKPVYVTRGLGMSVLPLRLFCRPELTFVELRGAQ